MVTKRPVNRNRLIDSESETISNDDTGSSDPASTKVVRRRSRRSSGRNRATLRSDSDEDSSSSSSESEEDSNAESSGVVAESEEEDIAQKQCFSPRTRLSITGRRPKDLETSTDSEFEEQSGLEESVIPASDDEQAVSSEYRSAKSDASEKSAAPEAEMTEMRTGEIEDVGSPQASTSHRAAPIVIEEESSVSTVEDAKSEGSVVILDDSTDEKDVDPQRNLHLTQDFHSLSSTSTPTGGDRSLVQPKIQTMLKKDVRKKEGVSAEYYSQSLEKLHSLRAELSRTQDLLQSLGHTLVDKGENLKRRMQSLQSDISEQENYISSLFVEERLSPSSKNLSVKERLSWNELVAGVKSIQPQHTGKQGLQTFNNQKTQAIDRLKVFHDAMENCPTPETLAPEPRALKVELMQHQKYGLAWMLWREKQKPKGGILGDDMGLGKTLSVIALCLAANEVEEGETESESESEDEDKKPTGWHGKGRRDSKTSQNSFASLSYRFCSPLFQCITAGR